MNNETIFHSFLKDSLQGFVDEKKAIGYSFAKGESLLKQFDKVVTSLPQDIDMLTKDLVMKWTERRPEEATSTQLGRISLMRGLAEYMNRMGNTAYVYPKAMVTVERYSYTPYIFTEKEIASIFTVCDDFAISYQSPNRHLVLSLIFRILYGCGLRISEAVNLTIADVNLKEGIIFIKNTKFNKERTIPIADTLRNRCIEYNRLVNTGKPETSYFFPSPLGGHYKSNTIYILFRQILWAANISHTGKGLRLHDLRHTFAVHCLKKWVLGNRDITNCIPYLSAYLGHEDLRGSQHYLRLTADLYPDIIDKVEKNCSWLIPEVNWDESY
ncbi:MAG: tyrosine-type recombinase/integrase [Tissierellia bacterium]|nr:tyrosine-type recombinase/integrase [Tissierellia bacterium]